MEENVSVFAAVRHSSQLYRIIQGFGSESINLPDVSYAAAWEIGKLMALKDKNFSTTLFFVEKKLLSAFQKQ